MQNVTPDGKIIPVFAHPNFLFFCFTFIVKSITVLIGIFSFHQKEGAAYFVVQ